MNLKKTKKILIIRLSSLGDILLTTPLIRTLRFNYPTLQIDFLLKTKYTDTLINNPYISNLRLYNEDKKNKKELIEVLKRVNYDIVIDLQHNWKSSGVTSKLNCPKLQFDKMNFKKFLLVNFKINKLKDSPQIPVRYNNTLHDFSLDNKGLDLFTTKTPSHFLTGDTQYIGFAPGAGHFTKIYPPNYFIELGKMLSKEGFKIIIFGGKSDNDICQNIASQIDGSINLCNDNNLLQTAADMKKCTALVCNDSGLMHAAGAMGVPVLTVFGSSVKEFGFTPYKNKNLILENNSLSCRPCSHIGRERCPKKHFKCMLDISPGITFNALNNLLNTL